MRFVDQETKSYTSSPRPSAHTKRLEARVQELTEKLDRALKEKADAGKADRSSGNAARDVQFQLAETERGRLRLEAEVKSYENKIGKLRNAMDDLVSDTNQKSFRVNADITLLSKHPKMSFNWRSAGQTAKLRNNDKELLGSSSF